MCCFAVRVEVDEKDSAKGAGSGPSAEESKLDGQLHAR